MVRIEKASFRNEAKGTTLMELPEDVVRWVCSNFRDADKEQALVYLRNAAIRTGELVNPRLLRCVAVGSRGELARLQELLRQLQLDWRDVVVAAEYTEKRGKLVRSHDFDHPL